VKVSSHEQVLLQHDKALFHKFAIASGLPVPNAIIIGRGGEISAIRDLRFPVVIKPANKQDFHLKGVSRIVLGHNPEQALIACQKLLTVTSEVIVQECLEGPDSNIYFCLFYRKDDSTKAIFTGQKLASVPAEPGVRGFA
jgi:D-aspartate ligase